MKYFKTKLVKRVLFKIKYFISEMQISPIVKGLAILFILANSFGCKKTIGPFSDVPNLTYTGHNSIVGPDGSDSIIEISFDFTDGDGDIGLDVNDTLPPFNLGSQYFFNLFISVDEIVDGVKKPILDPILLDEVQFNSRIPVITPKGDDKAIDGTFTADINTDFAPGNSSDSVIFEIFIYDKALNKSNVITTPIIHIKR